MWMHKVVSYDHFIAFVVENSEKTQTAVYGMIIE